MEIIKLKINNSLTFEKVKKLLKENGFEPDKNKGPVKSNSYLFINLTNKTYYTAKFSGGDNVPRWTEGSLFQYFIDNINEDEERVQADGLYGFGVNSTEEDIAWRLGKLSPDPFPKEHGPDPFPKEHGPDEYDPLEDELAQVKIEFPDNSNRKPSREPREDEDPKLKSINQAIRGLEKEKDKYLKNLYKPKFKFIEIEKGGEYYYSVAYRGANEFLAIKKSVFHNEGLNKTFTWIKMD